MLLNYLLHNGVSFVFHFTNSRYVCIDDVITTLVAYTVEIKYEMKYIIS